MTMAEKKLQSVQKKIEKLTKSLERYSNLLKKKTDKCIKLNCDWDDTEMRYHRDELKDMTDAQWQAWFDRRIEYGHVEDAQSRLENAFKRLERAESDFQKVAERLAEDEMIANKEAGWLEAMQRREEEYYKWLAEFKTDCLKDGIIIEEASANWITGTTRGGNHFSMYINSGWTERSLHSYTLRIAGITYFTSGLFSTGYRYLMSH